MNLLITDISLDINFIQSENSRYVDISKLNIANCLGVLVVGQEHLVSA